MNTLSLKVSAADRMLESPSEHDDLFMEYVSDKIDGETYLARLNEILERRMVEISQEQGDPADCAGGNISRYA